MVQDHSIAEVTSASSVARALGLDEQALEDALVWARRRTAELIRTLDDRALLALLDPPGVSVTRELHAIGGPTGDEVANVPVSEEVAYAPASMEVVSAASGDEVVYAPASMEVVPPPPAFSTDGPRPETFIGPAPTAPPGASRRRQASREAKRRRSAVNEALRLVSARRYPEAIERLEQVVRDKPQPRLEVLLSVVRARQAIEQRDLPRARACYEAALQLDPRNAVAERELEMLSAMGA